MPLVEPIIAGRKAEDKGLLLTKASEPVPVMKVEIPFGEGFERLLADIRSSGIYSNFGPQVRAFEAEFAQLVGADPECIVSASNATVGLQGAMLVLDLPKWTIQAWTFSATAHAARGASVELAFGDVELDSWVLDPESVSEGSGAVLTAPFGASVAVDKKWNHVGGLVVDAAASVGSPPVIDWDFSPDWAVVYSLHATKILGIGEGGMVLFSSGQLAKKFRDWSNFGFSGSRTAQGTGTNAKMAELLAAFGRFRLTRAGQELEEWQSVRSTAHKIGEIHGFNPVFSSESLVSPYWIAEFESMLQKKQVVNALTLDGIDTRDWWSDGCHQMPAFREIVSVSPLLVTDDLAARTIGLPFFRGMSPTMFERVSTSIGAALA